ncbi:MAG: hypothetical protein WAW96_13070 [Alphaproteobacteria bacterium]
MKKTQSTVGAGRLLRRQDMDAAAAQYKAAEMEQREKSARLRALRLAKEADDRKVAERAASDRAAAKRKPRNKAAAPSRSGDVIRAKDAAS